MRFMASTDKPRFSLSDGLWLALVVVSTLTAWRLLARAVAASAGGWEHGAVLPWDSVSSPGTGMLFWGGWLADLSLCLASSVLVIATGCLWYRQRVRQRAISRQGTICAAMLDAVPHPLFCEDAQGQCLATNEAYEHVFGAGSIGGMSRERGGAGSDAARERAGDPGLATLRDREGIDRRYRIDPYSLAPASIDAARLGMLHETDNPEVVERGAPGLDSALLVAMSHDLRTPMTGMLGAFELLGYSGLDAHQRTLLRGAESASHTLQRMLDDVLNLARLEVSGRASESVSFDPRDIATRELEIRRAEGIEVSASMADGIGILVGSEDGLKQSLHALWRYAVVKSSGSWLQSVRVLCEDERWQEIEWLLECVGTIPGAHLAGEARQTELIRRLVCQWCEHAGLSWWERDDGSARIRLGMKGRFERGGERASGLHEEAGTASRTVLVAEDNEITRTLLGKQLELLGLDCDLVNDGGEALEALSRKRYAMLLTDCQMPGIDGLELALRIRAMEKVRKLPIIALTANPSPGHREQCLRAGMDDVLPKSTRVALLADKLRTWLGPRSARGETWMSADGDQRQVDAEQLRTRMREVFGEDPSLLESYLCGMREEQQHLRAGMIAGDASRLRQVSHSLSGMSAFFGMSSLSNAASSVEQGESEREVFDRAKKLDACIDKFIDGMRGFASDDSSFPISTSKVSERSHGSL